MKNKPTFDRVTYSFCCFSDIQYFPEAHKDNKVSSQPCQFVCLFLTLHFMKNTCPSLTFYIPCKCKVQSNKRTDSTTPASEQVVCLSSPWSKYNRFDYRDSTGTTVKALYFTRIIFCVFLHECISLEFNFVDFAFVTLLQYTAKMFLWYLISRKPFIGNIHETNPMQNLRLLQYALVISGGNFRSTGHLERTQWPIQMTTQCLHVNCKLPKMKPFIYGRCVW